MNKFKILSLYLLSIFALCAQESNFKPFIENEKYGFTDENGNTIVKAKFDEVRNFHEGMAAVRKKDKWGFVNTEREAEYELTGNNQELKLRKIIFDKYNIW